MNKLWLVSSSGECASADSEHTLREHTSADRRRVVGRSCANAFWPLAAGCRPMFYPTRAMPRVFGGEPGTSPGGMALRCPESGL